LIKNFRIVFATYNLYKACILAHAHLYAISFGTKLTKRDNPKNLNVNNIQSYKT